GDFDAGRRTLVVGAVHGDETAGIAVADRLTREAPPADLDLWVIRDLNPDGVAAGTRGRADRGDLDRNLPRRRRPLGGVFYSGPAALSEPESRIAYRLISRLDPGVSIWFHQHQDLVDDSGGDVAVERRFARLSGLPLGRLPREPGSAVGWTNHHNPAGAAFVVELPTESLREGAVVRLARAVVAVTGVGRGDVDPG